MVLIYNVYLTDTPGNFNWSPDRGNLKNHSKLEVAKYSLCSLASAYEWTKAIINIELDPNIYTQKEIEDLPKFIYDIFKNVKVIFSPNRIKYQSDWKNIYNEINNDLVYLLCNHDHIFLDSNNQCLKDIIEEAKKMIDKNPTIAMSHWPEAIRSAKCGYIELNENLPRKYNEEYKIKNKYVSYESNCIDSLNIITKKLYYNWFFLGDWPNIPLVRTDGVSGRYPDIVKIKESIGLTIPKQLLLIPYKEQTRHFDGYSHQRIDNNTCPSLSIPYGFFESDIKIRYGYDDYKDGWVNINPKNSAYRAYDITGTDYRITLDDIPLFWKNRISEVDIKEDIDEEELIRYRLQSVLEMMYSDPRYSTHIDKEIELNVLKNHIKTYTQYELNETE
jgi:hypothetical protein